jgi:outer membrane protein OmpA-like peptidoglycan-associated protein
MNRSMVFSATSLALILGAVAADRAAGTETVLVQDVPSQQELNCILFGRCTPDRDYATRQVRFKTTEVPPPVAQSAGPPAVATAPGTQPFAASVSPSGESDRGTVLGLNIQFEYDSTVIMPESEPYLQRLGEVLKEPDNAGAPLIIVGHTDAVGSDEYNLHLSLRRAESVRSYLIEGYAIEPGRLLIQGMGERELLPALGGFDPRNRRVEFYAPK